MKEFIIGARSGKNIIISTALFAAGLGFFLSGLSSYYSIKILFFADTSAIKFIPQGITMLFYGTIAISLSIYNFLTILWNIGSGYNEFSTETEKVNIVRLGFPGMNRKLFFSYEFKNIKKIKFLIKKGLNPRNNVLLVLKDSREIPLFPPHLLKNPIEIEKKAIKLANLLKIPLESIAI